MLALARPYAGFRAVRRMGNWVVRSLGASIVVALRRRNAGARHRTWTWTLSGVRSHLSWLVSGGDGPCRRRNSSPHHRLGQLGRAWTHTLQTVAPDTYCRCLPYGRAV